MRSKRACTTRLDRSTEGTATLELAFLMPFLFALGFGVFEFGHLTYQYHLIVTGVRDASRYLAGLPRHSADDAAKNIAMRGTPDTTGELRVSWWNETSPFYIDYVSIPNDDGTGNRLYRGGDNIEMVKVWTSVPYQSLGFLEFLSIEPITLSARHEERLYQNR